MALSTTTLSQAVGAGDRIWSLASVAGDLGLPSIVNGLDPVLCLVCGGEAVQITRLIPGASAAEVQRGLFGSRVAAHPAGATVYLARPSDLYQQDPVGAPQSGHVQPWINTITGTVWVVLDDTWVPGGMAEAAFPSTSDGITVLMAAAPVDRSVSITATETQTFADEAGTQPVFLIGQTDEDDKFTDGSDFVDAAEGDAFTYTGTLSAGQDLIVTATAAVDDATGALQIAVTAADQGLVVASAQGITQLTGNVTAGPGSGSQVATLAAPIAATASENYDKTTDGAQTLLAALAGADRAVLITVVVSEAFADGDATQTVFTIGETDEPDLFADATLFIDASLGAIFTLSGTLTAGAALLVTGTPAAGTGTGAITVTVMAVRV